MYLSLLRRPASPERKLQPSQETNSTRITLQSINYNFNPAPESRPLHQHSRLLWSELSWCNQAPPPRQGGARFGRVFHSCDVCVSSYSFCSSYPCVVGLKHPPGWIGPHGRSLRPNSNATSEAPASRRSTRKVTHAHFVILVAASEP